MRFILPAVLLLNASFSPAQQRCSGVLRDSASRQPVEFANIGVAGKGIGTVSNEKGEYSFVLPDSLTKEKIRVSIIGYKPETYPAADFCRMKEVSLVQDAAMLQEVSVKVKKIKVATLGNETTNRFVSAGFKKNNLGAEVAVKLNIRHPQTHLKTFFVQINHCKLQKALFRLNIYSKDKSGDPGENILKQMIIVEPAEKTGLIKVDLLPYNLYVDDDVFVALEWIKDLGDVTGLMFSSKMLGSGTWYRQASQDKWKKMPSLGLGLHVEAAY